MQTKRGLNFKFEFHEHYIKLRRCNIPILEDLFDEPLSVMDLLLQLKSYGFNLLPEKKSDILPEF